MKRHHPPRLRCGTTHKVVVSTLSHTGWPLWAARQVLAQGYTLEHTVAYTGWPASALVHRG